MIKSDLMNRKIIWVLLLLVLLSGCGQRRQPDVEHFQGDVVATLQKPISQSLAEFVSETPPPEIITPQTSTDASTATPAGNLTPTSTGKLTPTSTIFQPTDHPYGVETTPTNNPSQTATPTLKVPDWEGVWNIWYQDSRGSYTAAKLTVEVDGTRLAGSAKIDGVDHSFKGDIFDEGTQVEGEWQTASDTGNFWWRMNTPETFVGSRESRFGFCGNRAAVQPNPCREVPQD